MAANDALREKLTNIIGGFSAKHLASFHPEVMGGDMRRVRLLLPACVATLIRINVKEQVLEYAHIGDTALFEVQRKGDVVNHTPNQMRKFDEEMLRFADKLRREKALPHFKDAVRLPAVVLKDKENGLRHNYVDMEGNVVPNEGSGALNGLPELAAYVSTGSIVFDPERTVGFCLMSDGLQLLEPLEETVQEKKQRLDCMGRLLMQGGLSADNKLEVEGFGAIIGEHAVSNLSKATKSS